MNQVRHELRTRHSPDKPDGTNMRLVYGTAKMSDSYLQLWIFLTDISTTSRRDYIYYFCATSGQMSVLVTCGLIGTFIGLWKLVQGSLHISIYNLAYKELILHAPFPQRLQLPPVFYQWSMQTGKTAHAATNQTTFQVSRTLAQFYLPNSPHSLSWFNLVDLVKMFLTEKQTCGLKLQTLWKRIVKILSRVRC